MNKYKAKKTEYAGILFDSKAEATRYQHLVMLEKGGKIKDLTRQVVFELAPSVILGGRKKPALRYVADFMYSENGVVIIEDVKGMITPVFRVKQHLMKSVHGIEVVTVKG